MDLSRQLKIASATGKLLYGQRQAVDACAKGEAKCVILAANCPQDYVDNLVAKHPEVTIHRALVVNRELGTASGKPFSVSTITVVDAGDSDLLSLDNNLA
ncbi:MAG: 50S ribosomal protein L30e [Flavobacteriaceae bacterium]|mgnify:CR=1 FL=1|nr:50S ribosomal protein L30e [Flavobacteriaceae bacterium]MAH60639.1 50S ribosomal protein L30e [Flavobacteriaceae bacterium]RAH13301.1 MAG: 50S ribosomal protein L30e [Euryarchaeota archaeon]|tara:strand:+ start:461 stop:760 length:300 start_codon:yes stop_codon:yes gene_type:complete